MQTISEAAEAALSIKDLSESALIVGILEDDGPPPEHAPVVQLRVRIGSIGTRTRVEPHHHDMGGP